MPKKHKNYNEKFKKINLTLMTSFLKFNKLRKWET